MIHLCRLMLCAAALLVLAVTQVAAEWTGGRGPGNRGTFPEIPFPRTPAVVWKSYLGSEFLNLPPSNTLVAASNVIVAYDKYLIALSVETGEPRWQQILPELPLGDLLLIDNQIIVTMPLGNVMAINPATGAQIWRRKLADRLRNGPLHQDGMLYYVTKANTMEALDPRTGRVVGTKRLPGTIEAGPAVLGRSLVFCYTDGTLQRIDEQNIVRWTTTLPNTLIGLTPVTDGRIMLVNTPSAIFAIDPSHRERTRRWVYPSDDRLYDPVILDGNTLYMVTRTGLLHAIDLETGTDRWTHGADPLNPASAAKPGLPLPAPPVGQPLGIGDHLLVRMEHGIMALYHKESGDLTWRYRLRPPTGFPTSRRPYMGAPAIVGDSLFFAGTDGMIYHLSASAPDTDAPTFSGVMPRVNERGFVQVQELNYLGALIEDEGAGFLLDKVTLSLNGVDMTSQMRFDARTGYAYIGLNPRTPLAPGMHRLAITAQDYRGNTGTLSHSFILGSPANTELAVVKIAGGLVPDPVKVRPGTIIVWENTTGSPRTIASEAMGGLDMPFTSARLYPGGVPQGERWVWIVPQDIEYGTVIPYSVRLHLEHDGGENVGKILGLIEIAEPIREVAPIMRPPGGPEQPWNPDGWPEMGDVPPPGPGFFNPEDAEGPGRNFRPAPP